VGIDGFKWVDNAYTLEFKGLEYSPLAAAPSPPVARTLVPVRRDDCPVVRVLSPHPYAPRGQLAKGDAKSSLGDV
jgi:hypothetical protein